MNCQQCIEQMNKIDWSQSNLDVYNELTWIVSNYDQRTSDYWDILEGLYTPYIAESIIIDRLQRSGVGAVKKLLERIDADDPPTLFKLSDDDRLEEAIEWDVRYKWYKIMRELLDDKRQFAESEEAESEEPEAVWVDEDDDFLTARRTL